MKVHYNYSKSSSIVQKNNQFIMQLEPDLNRNEKVSFVGSLKHPLIYRDAMLMLREIVISDVRYAKKSYEEYFAWLNQEINNRMRLKEDFIKNRRAELTEELNSVHAELKKIQSKIDETQGELKNTQGIIHKMDAWYEYDRLESQFWDYIRNRDNELWMVLDPVITVHPDQVSFEAFSLDESVYGCLSIDRNEFDIIGAPKLGTTNIDFSVTLAKQIERFRTYNDVRLSINPEGLAVETAESPEYVEKKIDLPDSWIKGFTQVSAAASLEGKKIKISPIDVYDICSFLKRNRAHESPRAMRWIFVPNERIKIIFEPWEKTLELSTIYTGKNAYTQRLWSRRRWLLLEKLIPITKSFELNLLGFGMPQFIVADLGVMKMTLGFTSWSANDWVKGTAFNIMAGFIGEDVRDVVDLLKKERCLGFSEISSKLSHLSGKQIKSGIGRVLRQGKGYYDIVSGKIRYRELLNVPLPLDFTPTTEMEKQVLSYLNDENFTRTLTIKSDKNENWTIEKRTFVGTKQVKVHSSSRRSSRSSYYDDYGYYGYSRRRHPVETRTVKKYVDTLIIIDPDKQITKLRCTCKVFQKGPRNISSPCSHILALYLSCMSYLDLHLKPKRIYSPHLLEKLQKE
jgi:hypothetical protein